MYCDLLARPQSAQRVDHESCSVGRAYSDATCTHAADRNVMNTRNVATTGNRLSLPSSPGIGTPWAALYPGNYAEGRVAASDGRQDGAGPGRVLLRLGRVLAEEVRDRLIHAGRMAAERK
jgi:hypothetical protein